MKHPGELPQPRGGIPETAGVVRKAYPADVLGRSRQAPGLPTSVVGPGKLGGGFALLPKPPPTMRLRGRSPRSKTRLRTGSSGDSTAGRHGAAAAVARPRS